MSTGLRIVWSGAWPTADEIAEVTKAGEDIARREVGAAQDKPGGRGRDAASDHHH